MRRAPSATCPWLGLRPYGVEDADWFFGRDDDVAACLEILARTSVLALVGPSGSGKSSLLRAGVAAALRRRGQPSVTITPGAHPMESLTALAQAPRGAALLVDQCEELFSLCEDPEEQREFLRALTAEAANRTVVVALRADHLADLATHTGFSRLVERGMYLVGGLDEEGLRTAVETPARQAGLLIEPGLVDLLVREVRNDPGALPLLSHALLETWKRREGSTLTVAGYRASRRDQRSRGPVGRRSLLTSRGGTVDTCCATSSCAWSLRAPRANRSAPGCRGAWSAPTPSTSSSSRCWSRARLVTSDDGALEITHEALARAWPRLRGWLDDDVEGQRIRAPPLRRRRRLGRARPSRQRALPRRPAGQGARLAAPTTDTALTEVERQFLEASSHHAEAEQQSIAERARAQARLIRRLRIVLGGAAVLLVLALVAGVLAAVQSDRAQRERRTGGEPPGRCLRRRAAGRRPVPAHRRHQPLAAARGRGCAAGRLAGDPGEPADRAGQASHAGPVGAARRRLPGESWTSVRDGRWIASSDDQNRMHLYDASTNRLLRSYDAGRPPEASRRSCSAAFSPDSRQLAVILEGRALHGAGAPAGPGHHAADDEARLPRRQAGVGGRRRVQRRRPLPGRHRADGPLVETATPARPRATRWSGTSAPRPRPPSGCRPEPTPRGWRSARTAGSCTPAGR